MDLIERQALISEILGMTTFGNVHELDKFVHKCHLDGAHMGGLRDAVFAIVNAPSAHPTYTDAEIQRMQDMEQAQLDKAFELGREDAKPQWIPCSEKLPENRVCVIVCFREWQQYAKRYIYSIVTGWYARKHSVRENVFSEWEADCDYDEDEDEFYIHEGWYEFTTQGNADLMNWYINAEVVAWMPMPEPYREEGEQK